MWAGTFRVIRSWTNRCRIVSGGLRERSVGVPAGQSGTRVEDEEQPVCLGAALFGTGASVNWEQSTSS